MISELNADLLLQVLGRVVATVFVLPALAHSAPGEPDRVAQCCTPWRKTQAADFQRLWAVCKDWTAALKAGYSYEVRAETKALIDAHCIVISTLGDRTMRLLELHARLPGMSRFCRASQKAQAETLCQLLVATDMRTILVDKLREARQHRSAPERHYAAQLSKLVSELLLDGFVTTFSKPADTEQRNEQMIAFLWAATQFVMMDNVLNVNDAAAVAGALRKHPGLCKAVLKLSVHWERTFKRTLHSSILEQLHVTPSGRRELPASFGVALG